jgi:fructose-1,6-bisphosphatase/inositol monophosphatase family enzyme
MVKARRPAAPLGVRRRGGALHWRRLLLDSLAAARGVVSRLTPTAGQRVVRGREAGYRSWDPEVIGVDTATERAVIGVLRRAGVQAVLLSEEAGAVELGRGARAEGGRGEPVCVVMDPFDGSLLYRRGIRAHWFTAIGIYGRGGEPQAAGITDHITGEVILADASGAVRIAHPGAPSTPLRPAKTVRLDGAAFEAYLMKPAFLYPTATALRPLFGRAKLVLPNGGPGGFADVACGRIDVYFAWSEALTEVFSALYIAERAGCVVSGWDGSPVRFRPDLNAVHSLVCSANPRLHQNVLQALRGITPPRGLQP